MSGAVVKTRTPKEVAHRMQTSRPDVSDDRRVLFIHAMYVHDRDRLVRTIKGGFERRVLEVLR